jgi:hypothetical protein
MGEEVHIPDLATRNDRKMMYMRPRNAHRRAPKFEHRNIGMNLLQMRFIAIEKNANLFSMYVH